MIGLAGRDLQERDHGAIGLAVLLNAQMGQFEHLLDPDAGVAQNLDDRPRHESADNVVSQVDSCLCPISQGIDAHPIGVFARGVLDVGVPLHGEGFFDRRGLGGVSQLDGLQVGGSGRRDECLDVRGEGRGACLHAVCPLGAALLLTSDVADADRTRDSPMCPRGGILVGPGGHIEVEAADRSQNALRVAARCSVWFGAQPLLPCGRLGFGQADCVDAGIGVFDWLPEQLHQVSACSVEAGVVLAGGDFSQVGNQEPANAGGSHVEAVDQFGGIEALGYQVAPQIVGFTGEQPAASSIMPHGVEIARRPAGRGQKISVAQHVLALQLGDWQSVDDADAHKVSDGSPRLQFGCALVLGSCEVAIPDRGFVGGCPVAVKTGLLVLDQPVVARANHAQ